MNLNKIKTTAIAGMLAASMLLPNMTAFAAASKDSTTGAVNGTPQIEKTVEVADGVTALPANTKVEYSVKQIANVSGNKAPNENNKFTDSTVSIDVSAAKKDKTDAFAANILPEDVINAMKAAPGEYTFEITETTTAATGTDFGWTTVDKNNVGTYHLRVAVKSGQEPMYFITTATNDATDGNYSKVENKVASAAYTNVYNKKSVDGDGNANKLTITKTIDDEDAAYVDPNATYEISVTFTKPDTQNQIGDDSFTVTTPATGAERKVSNNKDTVTITAKLKRNETIVVSNIPVGATYSVAEDTTTLANNSNFKEVKYTVTEGTTEGEESSTCENNQFGEVSESVEVHNDFQNITFTGVVTDIAPYVTLVVVAVAAIAAYVVMKRRVAR